MMEWLQDGSFVLVAGLFMIGFLVLIHEAGHFVAAKIFGVGVPVFSVGMGPRLFGFQWRGTDYRVSALPIGGYVQLSGADPFGEEDTAQHVPPDEDFMRKPVWQRLIIMAAGPGVNLALPFVLFTVLLMLGRPDVNSRVGVVLPGTPAEEAGFRPGDLVVGVDGNDVQIWHDVQDLLEGRVGTSAPVTFQVERDGEEVSLSLPGTVLRHGPAGGLDLVGVGVQPYYLSSRVGIEAPDGPAGRAGLQTGDRIVAVDGVEVDTWDEVLGALGTHGVHEVTYERRPDPAPSDVAPAGPDEAPAGVTGTVTLSLDGEPDDVITAYDNPWGLAPITVFASRVEPGHPAAQAGVQPNDRFLSVDGVEVLTFHHFIDLVARTAEGGTQPRSLELVVLRDGAPVTMTMTPQLKVVSGEAYARPIIGVNSYYEAARSVDVARKYYGFFEAVPRAVEESVEVVKRTASVLGNIFTGKEDPRNSVGGPVAIFYMAGVVAEQGFFQYASVIGVLSVSLGVINLLPVPVLDGGQILFYLLEGIRGRPLSLELRERFQMIGVVGLVILMLLVTANDITRWATM